MPFIHLPIQSGSNKILKLMNRKHKVEDYIDIYEKLREINNKIELSSDFIIGYPGETDKDFEDTLNLTKRIKFINSYSFIYSSRPGTTASKYQKVEEEICKERLKILQNNLFYNQKIKNKSFEKKYVQVLIENKMKKYDKFFGRNEYMTSVILDGNEDLIGKVVQVFIKESNQNTLYGELNNKKFEAA
tara:strand:- start:137 stop:700 length:564 start_codon:yes stop_codon:yes gene_type:complete